MPRNIAFLFPGQGAQYPGMGKDFWNEFSIVRETFEEADERLGRKLSKIVFEGPEQQLTETRNSQLGIYICSIAILRLLYQLFPQATPSHTAGLSLGEYSALCASKKLSFVDGVLLVDHRGRYMNDACEAFPGTMAVLLGMENEQVEKLVEKLNLPEELWVANYNCPGQVVISGTIRGIQIASQAAKESGAKRVLPLQVHGAFHSGLMKRAEVQLAPFIENAALQSSSISFVMNVTGRSTNELDEIRHNLIKQVTHPVRWEQGVRALIGASVDLFVECGPGKTLAGFYKRIGGHAPFVSIEKIADIKTFEEALAQ